MTIETTAALCIIGSILCLVLREYARTQAALLGIAVIAAALLGAMPELSRIVTAASGLYSTSGLPSEYFTLLCRALGIACLTELAVDICRDCGEQAIASTVTLYGRILLVALSLPLFVSLAETVLEVMG